MHNSYMCTVHLLPMFIFMHFTVVGFTYRGTKF